MLHDQEGGDAKYVLKNAEASALAAWVKDYAVSCGIAALRASGSCVFWPRQLARHASSTSTIVPAGLRPADDDASSHGRPSTADL